MDLDGVVQAVAIVMSLIQNTCSARTSYPYGPRDALKNGTDLEQRACTKLEKRNPAGRNWIR